MLKTNDIHGSRQESEMANVKICQSSVMGPWGLCYVLYFSCPFEISQNPLLPLDPESTELNESSRQWLFIIGFGEVP
jgi:hypothetical protein